METTTATITLPSDRPISVGDILSLGFDLGAMKNQFALYVGGLFLLAYFLSNLVAYLHIRTDSLVSPLTYPVPGQHFVEYFIMIKTSLKPGSSFDSLLRGRILLKMRGSFADSSYIYLKKSKSQEYFMTRGGINIFVYHSPYSLGDVREISFQMIHDTPYEIPYVEWEPCYVRIMCPLTREHWSSRKTSRIRSTDNVEVTFKCVRKKRDANGILKSICLFHPWLSMFNSPTRVGAYSNIANVVMVYFAPSVIMFCTLAFQIYSRNRRLADHLENDLPRISIFVGIIGGIEIVSEAIIRNAIPQIGCPRSNQYDGLAKSSENVYLLRDFFLNMDWDNITPIMSLYQPKIRMLHGLRHGYAQAIFPVRRPQTVFNLWKCLSKEESREPNQMIRALDFASLPLPSTLNWVAKEATGVKEEIMITEVFRDFSDPFCFFCCWLQDWPLNFYEEPEQAGLIFSHIICKDINYLSRMKSRMHRLKFAQICFHQWHGLFCGLLLPFTVQMLKGRNLSSFNANIFMKSTVNRYGFRMSREVQAAWGARRERVIKFTGIAQRILDENISAHTKNRCSDTGDVILGSVISLFRKGPTSIKAARAMAPNDMEPLENFKKLSYEEDFLIFDDLLEQIERRHGSGDENKSNIFSSKTCVVSDSEEFQQHHLPTGQRLDEMNEYGNRIRSRSQADEKQGHAVPYGLTEDINTNAVPNDEDTKKNSKSLEPQSAAFQATSSVSNDGLSTWDPNAALTDEFAKKLKTVLKEEFKEELAGELDSDSDEEKPDVTKLLKGMLQKVATTGGPRRSLADPNSPTDVTRMLKKRAKGDLNKKLLYAEMKSKAGYGMPIDRDRSEQPLSEMELNPVGVPHTDYGPKPHIDPMKRNVFLRHKSEIAGYCCGSRKCSSYLNVHNRVGFAALETMSKMLKKFLHYAMDSDENCLSRDKMWLRKKMVRGVLNTLLKKADFLDDSIFKTRKEKRYTGFLCNSLLTECYTTLTVLLDVLTVKHAKSKEINMKIDADKARRLPMPKRCVFCGGMQRVTAYSAHRGCHNMNKLVKFFSNATISVAEKEMNIEYMQKLSIQKYCAVIVNEAKKELIAEFEDPPVVLSTKVICGMIHALLQEMNPKNKDAKDMTAEELRRMGTRRQRIQARKEVLSGRKKSETEAEKRAKFFIESLSDDLGSKWKVNVNENKLGYCTRLLAQTLVQERILGFSIYSGFISKEHEALLCGRDSRLAEVENIATKVLSDIARKLIQQELIKTLESSQEVDVMFTSQKYELSYLMEAMSVLQIRVEGTFLKTSCFYVNLIAKEKVTEFREYLKYMRVIHLRNAFSKTVPYTKMKVFAKLTEELQLYEVDNITRVASPALRWGPLAFKGVPGLADKKRKGKHPEPKPFKEIQRLVPKLVENTALDPKIGIAATKLLKLRQHMDTLLETEKKDNAQLLKNHLAKLQSRLTDQVANTHRNLLNAHGYSSDVDHQNLYEKDELFYVEFYVTRSMRATLSPQCWMVTLATMVILTLLATGFTFIIGSYFEKDEIETWFIMTSMTMGIYGFAFQPLKCIFYSLFSIYVD